MFLVSVRSYRVANTAAKSEASELIYQGPLIGMRSTRPKSNDAQPNPTQKKAVSSETPSTRRIS
jgi:hypothetical protein